MILIFILTNGVREFLHFSKNNIYDVFMDRNILKNIIKFLNKECKIKYIYIRNYFDISRGCMDNLKI